MSNILRRLVLVFALAALCLPAQAQRFVKVFDNIPALLAGNPNDVNTNAFVAGLSTIADGGGGFYTWKAGSTAATNADLSILKANNYSAGRWFRFNGFIIAGGTNQFDTIYVTNLYVTNLTVTSTNTFITNFFFNNTYITNISQGDNWVAEGLTQTNSDLAGIGRTWKLIATNSVEVGQPGAAGLITIASTNSTYTVSITVDANDNFIITNVGGALVLAPNNLWFTNVNNAIPRFYVASGDTNTGFAASAFSLSDSDGAIEASDVLGYKAGSEWGAGTPNLRDGGLILRTLVNGTVLPKLDIDGSTGTMTGYDNAGNPNFKVSNASGYTATSTNYLSDDGTYHAVDTLTDGTDFIEVIGGKAYFSAGLDLGSDSSPFGPVDDIQMEGTLNVFGSGVGTANYEKFTIDHQGSSGVILDSVAGGSGTARDILFRIGGQGKVKITSGALVPASSADYNLGATTTATSFWNDVFSKGIYYTYGFGEGTADTESGAFYHNGSSALITESLSAGSGVARDFYWKSNGVTVDVLALNSGYTGTGTKFKSDDGTYKSVGGGGSVNPSSGTVPFNSGGSFVDSLITMANFQTVAMGSLTNSTVLSVRSYDTNAAASYIQGYLFDSDGAAEAGLISFVKNTGWGIGDPSQRDGTISFNTLHDGLSYNRFQIDGSSGDFTFRDKLGANLIFSVANDGGGYFGSQALYEWSNKEFVVERDNSIDGDGRVEVYFESIDSPAYNQNAGAYFYNSALSNSVTTRLTLQAVDDGTNPRNRNVQLVSAYDQLRLSMSAEGTTYVDFNPTASASTVPFKLNATTAHTSNLLFDLENNGTSALAVGATNNNVLLFGTTNQVVFGGTNSAPSSSLAPTKWISVMVTGQTNAYRLPLYE